MEQKQPLSIAKQHGKWHGGVLCNGFLQGCVLITRQDLFGVCNVVSCQLKCAKMVHSMEQPIVCACIFGSKPALDPVRDSVQFLHDPLPA